MNMEGIKGGCLSLLGREAGTSSFGHYGNDNSLVDPVATVSSKELDSLIAREMARLSMQEREIVFEDIHGISKAIDEDPDYVNAQLAEMDYQLLKLLNEASAAAKGTSMSTTRGVTRTAYEEAEAMSPTYVKDRDFRLMFLRAEKFGVKDAADRMIKYFEFKKKIFGKEKLVKNITLEDLDQDDMECLASGGCQVSPYKDAAGRHIISFLRSLRRHKNPENAMRATYYILMSVMESVDAQKRGIVGIWYYVNITCKRSLNSELRRALPINYASLHVCLNDPGTYEGIFVKELTRSLNTKSRVRYRLHWGSNIECLYELGQFGIPLVALPVSTRGEYQNKDHLLWLEKRRQSDAEKERHLRLQTLQNEIRPNAVSPFGNSSVDTSENHDVNKSQNMNNTNNNTNNMSGAGGGGGGGLSEEVQIILPDDVLFGRTRGVVAHPGNTRFRQIIDIYMSRYEEAPKFEKKLIAESIVRMIQESAGRFLKSGSNGVGWEVVDDVAAREKVAHAFRNRRKYHGYGV